MLNSRKKTEQNVTPKNTIYSNLTFLYPKKVSENTIIAIPKLYRIKNNIVYIKKICICFFAFSLLMYNARHIDKTVDNRTITRNILLAIK